MLLVVIAGNDVLVVDDPDSPAADDVVAVDLGSELLAQAARISPAAASIAGSR